MDIEPTWSLKDRMERAADILEDMVSVALPPETELARVNRARLKAKATGVRLAISYLDEWLDEREVLRRKNAMNVCPQCEGEQGQTFTWDDDLGIRHVDWVKCSNCKGSGMSETSEES